jgi:hypothetical protein
MLCRLLKVACFMVVPCLAYSLTLKMEATCFSDMSVDFQWTTWRYIPDDRTLHNHCSENLNFFYDMFQPDKVIVR